MERGTCAMNHRAPLIELDHVEKRYGRERVVAVESLVLNLGECVLITGANGSGKSTLLRLLAGVSRPDRGRVRRSPSATLGYVPQSGGLYPELSIRANLELRRRLWNRDPMQPESAWYIRDLGLDSLLAKTPSELSGGFYRLAAVAAALHAEPEWLFLDEPFSGLDPERRKRLNAGLQDLAASLDLLVISAPNLGELEGATRTLRMESGQLQ